MTDSQLTCPVCGFRGLSMPPYQDWPGLPVPERSEPPYQDQFGGPSFEICDSCGFEFGFDDDAAASGSATSFEEYRQRWVASGCAWWGSARSRPKSWDGTRQLIEAGLAGTDQA